MAWFFMDSFLDDRTEGLQVLSGNPRGDPRQAAQADPVSFDHLALDSTNCLLVL